MKLSKNISSGNSEVDLRSRRYMCNVKKEARTWLVGFFQLDV